MLLLVVAIGFLTLGGNTQAPSPMTLTLFTGTATIQRAGSSVAVAGRSGDGLNSGDTVATGVTGKALITYPDGSVTRLDSATTVKVSARRAAGGAVQTSFQRSVAGSSAGGTPGRSVESVQVRMRRREWRWNPAG